MKKFKRIGCLALAALILFSFTAPASYAGTSLSAITSDSIKEKQNQISESEKVKKQIQENISNAKALKAELEGLKKDTAAYIEKIDAEIVSIQEKIDELNTLITEKEEEITEITAELEEAIATEDAQYAAMKQRVKFMYEKGDTYYLELMLSAESFSDFLTKANYVDQLEAYDRKKLDEYVATREWTELCKETLESEKEVLDEAKAAEEEEEAAQEELLSEKQTQLASYNTQIDQKTAEISANEEDLEEMTDVIEALEAAILAEQKQIAAANGVVLNYDGGKFTWPAPSYTRITDDFGYRTDPITGATSYHSGIDMGAPAGSKILAAYDGVVVAAAYNSSMGNYVMINHGDGLYTVYMHASKLLVSTDDIVARGEQIACVGTTGRSTGNHLHFSVRLNGSYVNPWPYLGVSQ